MTIKSTLNEINRLEGIAQACARRRPIVPMQGVVEDCELARQMVEEIGNLDCDISRGLIRVIDFQTDLDEAQADLDNDKAAQASTKDTLDRLMASLSARLER